MMAAKINPSVVVALLLMIVCSTSRALAQNIPKWEFGIAANYGEDKYNKKFYNFKSAPGVENDYKSEYSWGAGIWGEKHLKPSLSALVQANYYTSVIRPAGSLCGCSSLQINSPQRDKYHWAGLAGGLRWYVNPASAINIFLEGKVKADYFVGFTRINLYGSRKVIVWHAYGYQRLVPSLSGTLGFRWDRLALMWEYDRNVPRTFIRNIGTHYGIIHGVKSGILRQGLTFKASFTLVKAR